MSAAARSKGEVGRASPFSRLQAWTMAWKLSIALIVAQAAILLFSTVNAESLTTETPPSQLDEAAVAVSEIRETVEDMVRIAVELSALDERERTLARLQSLVETGEAQFDVLLNQSQRPDASQNSDQNSRLIALKREFRWVHDQARDFVLEAFDPNQQGRFWKASSVWRSANGLQDSLSSWRRRSSHVADSETASRSAATQKLANGTTVLPVILAALAFLVVDALRRREVEAEMNSRARRRSTIELFHQSPASIVAVDEAGTILWVNDAASSLLEESRVDCAGRSIRDFLAERQDAEELLSAIQLQKPFPGKEVIVRGAVDTACEMRTQRMPSGERNEPETTILWLTDVSGLRAAEKSLSESRQSFSLAIRGSNDALWDYDIHAERIACSPRFDEMLGYDSGELPTAISEFQDLIHPADKERSRIALQDHLERVAPYDIEHRMRCKGGEYRWLRCRGRAVHDEDGNPIRMAGSTTDVSEQKLQHEALVRFASEMEEARCRIEEQAGELSRKAEELAAANAGVEAASRSKSEFLANMSHEIRTPMNAIIGMTEIVLDGRLDAEQREMLEIVHSSGQHLLSLINDVLDFSKIEVDKLRLDPTVFDLAECIGQSLGLFRLAAQTKGIELLSEIDSDVPSTARGDVGRIRQILVNLLGNAVKFTSRGAITLSVRLESKASSSLRLHFVVRDTGIGIPAQQLDRIFKPFEQADGSTTRQFGGTGLGLSIVRRLVELMNGSVWVESEEGQGSGFHFIIQMEKVERDVAPRQISADSIQASGSPSNAATELPPLRVLVAEDHPVNQKLICRLLEIAGHSVKLVENGQEAVDFVSTQECDLILMDMMMPVLNGIEATQAIRKREANLGRRIPIVALTANAMLNDRAACLQAGMDGYVAKPIRRHELFGEMARVFRDARRAAVESSRTPSDRLGDRALELIDQDLDLFEDLVATFAGTAPALSDELAKAARSGNDVRARELANQLRGAASVFGASPAARKLASIETAFQSSTASRESQDVDSVRSEIDALVAELRNRIAAMTPAARS